jgi:hypothetical protein
VEGDSRGCVANTPGLSPVFFQEGDKCPILGLNFGDVGHVGGTLFCSTELPAEPLDADNCAINKAENSYPPDATGCAPVSS